MSSYQLHLQLQLQQSGFVEVGFPTRTCAVHNFNLEIPRFFPRTVPISPDEPDATGQDFFVSRTHPTSLDGSNQCLPLFIPCRDRDPRGPPGVL